MTDICKHGGLKIKCEICERDAEIENLKKAKKRYQLKLGMVTKENLELKQSVRELAKSLKAGLPYLPSASSMGFIGLNAEKSLNNSIVKSVMDEGG